MTAQRSQLEALGYFDSPKVSNKRIEIALEDVLQKVKGAPVTNSQPDLSEFTSRREKYLKLFNEIMDKNNLDALIFPQIFREIPLAGQDTRFPMTSVPQVNILGLPAVTVPAGYTGNGAPLSLIFIGRKWSESLLLSISYSYEQSTKHRLTPTLKSESLANGVVSTR
jgi:Asp-tRNA(Asn)/Glu-tRNA(Gln) amidotransferase A subunit family amidase